MANFLTHLAERSLGLMASVRPDIPPVFADLESRGEEPGFDIGETRQAGSTIPGHHQEARETTASNDSKIMPADKKPESSAIPVSTHIAPTEKSPVNRRLSSVNSPLRLALLHPKLKSTESPHPTSEKPVTSLESSLHFESRSETGNSMDKQNSLQEHIRSKQPDRSRARLLATENQPLTSERTNKVGSTVQVTIGRVEVRVTVPQPPLPISRQSENRSGNHVTLEQYLSERNGSRR
jgi:hypothetical protein